MAESGKPGKRKFTENDKERSANVKKFAGHWSQGLLSSMSDPELIVESDDKLVVIKDKYPKAKHHFLVMPKESLPNLKSLTKEHLGLLKHMEKTGQAVADKADKIVRFRLGYHAVPSMSHLHLHVISQDFDSPCLKTKKHWNSFTTEYFVDSKEIIKMLEKDGKVHFDVKDSEALLKQDLRCHVCHKSLKNIPTLKEHIKTHDYSIS